jgi:hypothetical protein
MHFCPGGQKFPVLSAHSLTSRKQIDIIYKDNSCNILHISYKFNELVVYYKMKTIGIIQNFPMYKPMQNFPSP